MSSPVKDFVESTIRNNNIVIFSKSWCPYCRASKEYLSPEGDVLAVELDEKDNGSAIQTYLHETRGLRTVPQVFINGHFIGGNSDLQAKSKDDIRGLIAGPHV